MKLKKITAFIFALMLIFLYTTPLFAEADGSTSENPLSLKFSLLSEDGKQVVFAKPNDTITVSFIMERLNSEENYTTNGFQNYINYDRSFFELVDDSIVCYDTGAAIAKRQNSITYGEIVQCQNMGSSYDASFVFCTFKLKVIGESDFGMVRNGEVYAFDTAHRSIAVAEQNLRVIIDLGCEHESKTKFDARSATCTENGWHAYCVCDACGAFFDESGESLIADIPYIKAAHQLENTLSYDEHGHWYACVNCDEKVNYFAHHGGMATCISKAVCKSCGQEYGSFDRNNHAGNTVVKNQKEATDSTDGYTGDVYCADCEELLTKGEVIPAPSSFNVLFALIFVFVLLFFVILLAFVLIVLRRSD